MSLNPLCFFLVYIRKLKLREVKFFYKQLVHVGTLSGLTLKPILYLCSLPPRGQISTLVAFTVECGRARIFTYNIQLEKAGSYFQELCRSLLVVVIANNLLVLICVFCLESKPAHVSYHYFSPSLHLS